MARVGSQRQKKYCLQSWYDVTMLCAIIKVKTDTKIDVCLFKNYIS